MARLLPSRTDQPIERDRDPSVLYVDSDRAENVISTLSGDTAMKTFRMLNDEALTASEVADGLDLSVQNASYHLENLQDADLVEVVDTCYSEKGREMAIYAVTSEPKVLVLGTEQDQGTLIGRSGRWPVPSARRPSSSRPGVHSPGCSNRSSSGEPRVIARRRC